MEDNIYNIEFKELLRQDYTRNYLEIKYNENINKFIKVYLYNSEFGTIEIINSPYAKAKNSITWKEGKGYIRFIQRLPAVQ